MILCLHCKRTTTTGLCGCSTPVPVRIVANPPPPPPPPPPIAPTTPTTPRAPSARALPGTKRGALVALALIALLVWWYE